MRFSYLAPPVLIVALALTAVGQETSDLTSFITANEKFGRKLLKEVHAANPKSNIAISPLPVSYLFGEILEDSVNGASRDEIIEAFEWKNIQLRGPSHILLEAFRPPADHPIPLAKPGVKGRSTWPKWNLGDGVWMRTAFIYRGKNTIRESFLAKARDFGTDIFSVDTQQGVRSTAKRWWKDYVPSPSIMGKSDFYAAGMTHVADVWRGNTFSSSSIHKGEFVLSSGEHKAVDMMPSDLSAYSHVRTENFEAIVLPCWTVDLTVVLPAEGKDILQTESELVDNYAALHAALRSEPGMVELPKTRFHFENDLGSALRQMHVQKVFNDLEIVEIPQSHLKQVAQSVDIEINEHGIRANAGTIMNGVYGGIMGAQQPFHMTVNRPFLFFIHDHLTNSLLFLGAVMDPSQQ